MATFRARQESTASCGSHLGWREYFPAPVPTPLSRLPLLSHCPELAHMPIPEPVLARGMGSPLDQSGHPWSWGWRWPPLYLARWRRRILEQNWGYIRQEKGNLWNKGMLGRQLSRPFFIPNATSPECQGQCRWTVIKGWNICLLGFLRKRTFILLPSFLS